MSRPAALIFDLDGTLSDPSPGIFAGIRHAFERLSHTSGRFFAAPEGEALRSWIGPPLRASFAAVVGPELADAGLGHYRELYETSGLFENAPYDGVDAMLDAFAATGAPLYIATSKPRKTAVRIIDHFGWGRRFRAIAGATPDGSRESKLDVLEYLLANEHIPADRLRVAMIGDRKYDVEGAHAVGILAVGA